MKKLIAGLVLTAFVSTQYGCTNNQFWGTTGGAIAGGLIGAHNGGAGGAALGAAIGGLAGLGLGTLADKVTQDSYDQYGNYNYDVYYVKEYRVVEQVTYQYGPPRRVVYYDSRYRQNCTRYTYYSDYRTVRRVRAEYVVIGVWDAAMEDEFLAKIDPENEVAVSVATSKWNLPANVSKQIMSALYDARVTGDYEILARVLPSLSPSDFAKAIKSNKISDKLVKKVSADLSNLAGEQVDATQFIQASIQ